MQCDGSRGSIIHTHRADRSDLPVSEAHSAMQNSPFPRARTLIRVEVCDGSYVDTPVHRYDIRLDSGDTPQKLLNQLAPTIGSFVDHEVLWFQYTNIGNNRITGVTGTRCDMQQPLDHSMLFHQAFIFRHGCEHGYAFFTHDELVFYKRDDELGRWFRIVNGEKH